MFRNVVEDYDSALPLCNMDTELPTLTNILRPLQHNMKEILDLQQTMISKETPV